MDNWFSGAKADTFYLAFPKHNILSEFQDWKQGADLVPFLHHS